jgi:DNA repair photolyase
MKINEIICKTALSKSNLPGLDYSLNPYRGCQHNCAYCYVPNVLRIERNLWGSFVDVKTNIPNVLSKELKNKKKGVVGISTVTDPYQPVERKYRLTRYCLEQLLIHDFQICIQTKSDLILRDIDLISKFSNVEVMVSIGTLDDSERIKLEPNSSPIRNRLNVLQKFSDIGIKNTVFFGPIYPTIKREDIENIVDTFKKYGAQEIMVDKLNLKPGIKDNVVKVFPPYKKLIDSSNRYSELYNEVKKVSKSKKIKAVSAF